MKNPIRALTVKNKSIEGTNNQYTDNITNLQGKIEKLVEENDLFKEAQRISGLGIWRYDIINNKVTWSEKVYEIYEMTPFKDVPVIEDVLYYSTPAERARIEGLINGAINSGQSYEMDCSIKTKTGIIKHLHATGQPYYSNNGKVSHLLGTVHDITEKINLLKTLQFSEFTIDSLSDGIFWLDENAKFIKVNNAACQALGYTRDELLKMRGADLNPDFTIEKSKNYWEETKQKGVLTFETYHRRKDGTLFPVEITNNILQYEGKELRCSIVRDISKRKANEAVIKNYLNELERLKGILEKENIYLQQEIKIEQGFGEIITFSARFKKILSDITHVAPSKATVLLLGESGTGKELLARTIHNLSDRKQRPLIKVNCAALPEQLIESELFGHEKGAFTGAFNKKVGRFELADKGTIFLDEIGDMPFELQSKLLRVLQEGEFDPLGSQKTIKVDIRVIAATNKNLREEIQKGKFREDLFYRLNVFPIETIPLRERKEDITGLMKFFLDKYARQLGKVIDRVPVKIVDELLAYDWPGNIRELENIIERAVIITKGKILEFGNWLRKESPILGEVPLSFKEMERKFITEALEKTGGRISGEHGAAKLLGLKPKTLESKMKNLAIKRITKK